MKISEEYGLKVAALPSLDPTADDRTQFNPART